MGEATQRGPVDLAVILFEGSEFNGDVAPALLEVHEAGTVRILDLALVSKLDDDRVVVVEVEDSDLAENFGVVVGESQDLLNDTDLEEVGAGLEPGSSALVLVWENTWAARVAAAVRDSGGRVIVQERIPAEVVDNAFGALAG